MTKRSRVAAGLTLTLLVLLINSLNGSVSSAKSEHTILALPERSQASSFQTQPISDTETLFDVFLTDEGIFPPILNVPPDATVQWTNQTSQTQRIEGTWSATIPEAETGVQTIFLPLITKDGDQQGNAVDGDSLTANNIPPPSPVSWQSGDILPGESFSRTFDQSGWYAYSLPDSTTLTGSIIVPLSNDLSTFSTLTVNATTDDRPDNHNCTLREAVIAANTNTAVDDCGRGSKTDTIILPAGTYALSITGKGEDAAAKGDLDVKSKITIMGAGARTTIIDASALSDRVFHVLDYGDLTIKNVTITNGSGSGGGIFNEGKLTLDHSTLRSNSGDSGGGLKNDGYGTLDSSTISENSADFGGGIFNRGTLTLNNSTVSGNIADFGGGVKNQGTLKLNHSTLSANTAANEGGGINNFSYGKVYFRNTIIAGNTAHERADCSGFHRGSQGFNLVGKNTGCPADGPGDQTTTDPRLGSLQDNGGDTFTHALLSDSPASLAIDAVPADKCLFNTDQRGVSRPQGAGCDIGSFEFEDIHIFTVNTTADTDDGKCTTSHCTLREAINTANAHSNSVVLDEIHFDIPPGSLQTIQLTSALPVITDPVIVDGTTQPGFAGSPIIELNGGAVVGAGINGLEINTGNSVVRGLLIRNFSGDGIRIVSGTGNTIQGNNIFNNGQLGLDLGGDGITPNDIGAAATGFDPDLGANNLQNFPVLDRAFVENDKTHIQGRLNSVANSTFTLEFFANTSCDPLGFGEGQTLLGSISVTTDGSGNAIFTDPAFPFIVPNGQFITATATDANGNTSEFARCLTVGPNSDSWPTALRLVLAGDPPSATVDQFIDQPGQSRWYKFTVKPNSKLIVTLTNLPANYDLTVFKDIAATYEALNTEELASTQDLLQLNAEFASDAFAADAFAPAARSQDTFAPLAYAPEAFAPADFASDAFAPAARSPEALAPAARSPEALAPAARSPEAFTPDAFSPDAFSPAARSPESFAPAARSDAFSSAQIRSLIGFSAFDGTTSEEVIINTWNNTGDFYVRVRGRGDAFSLAAPFRLTVSLFAGTCSSISPDLPGMSLTPTAGSYRTIILTDLDRMEVAPGDLATLQNRLAALAARTEVAGVVVDVGADARVAAANAQADANPGCPYAKNLVAAAIKDIINGYRALNPLDYVVIVGNDETIPFFRYPDNSLLGNEMEYVPPVRDETASQASLRQGYILTQDAYGSNVDLALKVNEFPIPDLAVGRLVETGADVITVIDAYLGTDGGVVSTPTSALVTGYDFLEDVARAVQTELEAGLASDIDTLIAPGNLSPQDPAAWTAADLRAALLNSPHDLVFLAGHFSANSTLAADYSTRLVTADLISSPVDEQRHHFQRGLPLWLQHRQCPRR
jgi:CSLREA domain-containing protein